MGPWLVTGGAGYIGASVVHALASSAIDAVVLDNLSTGHPDFLHPSTPFVEGDVLDTEVVTSTLRQHGCDGVIHCAGYKWARESFADPSGVDRINAEGTRSVLAAMKAHGTRALVYSSSAAVYGEPAASPLDEDSPLMPAPSIRHTG